MIVAVLVHGFNVWDGGRATVGKLRPFFADQKVPYVMVNYGWFGIGRTYLKNRKVAKSVARACVTAKQSGHQVIVVGHSNGCAITHIAAERYGALIDKAVYINPALDADMPLPQTVRTLDVWHSLDDKPVKYARLLPRHPWGAMGSKGYCGPADGRITNFDKQHDFEQCSRAHSDVFSTELLPYFGPVIAGTTLEGL